MNYLILYEWNLLVFCKQTSVGRYWDFNSLPNDEFSNLSKLKAFENKCTCNLKKKKKTEMW